MILGADVLGCPENLLPFRGNFFVTYNGAGVRHLAHQFIRVKPFGPGDTLKMLIHHDQPVAIHDILDHNDGEIGLAA